MRLRQGKKESAFLGYPMPGLGYLRALGGHLNCPPYYTYNTYTISHITHTILTLYPILHIQYLHYIPYYTYNTYTISHITHTVLTLYPLLHIQYLHYIPYYTYSTYTISHITQVPSELALTASEFELDIRIQETGPLCPCRIPSSFWYVGLISHTRTWIQAQSSNNLSYYLILTFWHRSFTFKF